MKNSDEINESHIWSLNFMSYDYSITLIQVSIILLSIKQAIFLFADLLKNYLN